MKFLVDAQLPVRLARLLQEAADDTIHTLNLPQQNTTPKYYLTLFVSIQEKTRHLLASGFLEILISH